jgi:ABC-type branched-subunit amino acid transport system substrate-binding protein
MRVAFVRPKSGYTLPIAEAFLANLSFNGKSAIANGDDFRQIVFADPSDQAVTPDWASVVSQIVAMRPHAIVFVGEDELVPDVFAPVERAWPKGEPRPTWISTTNLRGAPLFTFIGKDAERRKRFFGISEPSNTPANARLAMRYTAEFGDKMTTNDTPTPAYDAIYLLAYAAYVVGDDVVTGSSLARGIARLVPPGPSIDVGPTHIFEVIDALKKDGNVDLNGAGYPLDFDFATGESPATFVVQCVRVDARGAANDALDSGLTWDASTKKLRGTLRCP